jgi:TetR/AcrR family transcriptional repressor of lmrAB and yxaGH operons
MPKPKTDSKERLIEAASRLFAQQGYQATGLSQIVEESGAPRGSVYFLFPEGKEEIAVEALKLSATRIRHLLQSTAESSDTVKDWIRRIAASLAQSLEASAYRSGSPLAAVTLDGVDATSPSLGQACHRAYDAWIEDAAHLLQHKYGMDRAGAEKLAVSAIAAIEGAVILCRARKSTEPLAIVADQIAAWTP